MREIKFRAWDKKQKKMFKVVSFGNIEYKDYPEGGFYDTSDIFETGIWVNDGCFPERQDLKDFELMQYTGLKDKHEKKIYEGDILRSFHFQGKGCIKYYLYHIVEWSDKYSAWFMKSRGAKDEHDGCLMAFVYFRNSKKAEVIGNIHDNPELLK